MVSVARPKRRPLHFATLLLLLLLAGPALACIGPPSMPDQPDYGAVDLLASVAPGHNVVEPAIAYSGSLAAISLPADGPDGRGAVYLYERSAQDARFHLLGNLPSPQPTRYGFGASLAWSAAGLVVGFDIPMSDGGPRAAYVFPFTPASGAQGSPDADVGLPVSLVATALRPLDGAANLAFGATVAAFEAHADRPEERVIVVGAPAQRADVAGAAYVFRQAADGTWHQEAKLVADGPRLEPTFGSAVSVSGANVAVGAPGDVFFESEGYKTPQSHVYLFRFESGAWSQEFLAQDVEPLQLLWSRAISLQDDELLVGSNHGPGPPGAAYVLQRQPWGNWTLVATLEPSGLRPGEHFAAFVDLDAGSLAVSAPGGEGQGAVYIFERECTQPPAPGLCTRWVQRARLAPPDCEASIYRPVALFGPGSVLAPVFSRSGKDLGVLAYEFSTGEKKGFLESEGVGCPSACDEPQGDGEAGGCKPNEPEVPIDPEEPTRVPKDVPTELPAEVPAEVRPDAICPDVMPTRPVLDRVDSDVVAVPRGCTLPPISLPLEPDETVVLLPSPNVELEYKAGDEPGLVEGEVKVTRDVQDLVPESLPGFPEVPISELPEAIEYVQVLPTPGQLEAPPEQVTIRIEYGPLQVGDAGSNPEDLTVHYWNGEVWVDLMSEVPADGVVKGATPEQDLRVFAAGTDPVNHVAWATVEHTSTYALAPGQQEASGPRTVEYGTQGGAGLALDPMFLVAGLWLAVFAVWGGLAILFRRSKRQK